MMDLTKQARLIISNMNDNYDLYSRLLKQTLVELRHYAQRTSPIGQEIREYLTKEAEHYRELRNKSKQRASRVLQAADSTDGNT